MSEVITHEIDYYPNVSVQRGPNIATRNKSPQN